MMLTASGGLDPSGGRGDLLSAIQAAADAVTRLPRHGEPPRGVCNRRIGGRELNGQQRTAAREALAKIAATGTPWSLVELRSHGGESPWQDLAAASRGRSERLQLQRRATGRLPGIAARPTDATGSEPIATIHFNPKHVAGYRLLGHEAATLTGSAGDPLEIELHAGQTPTCMYELVLNPPEQTEERSRAAKHWHDRSHLAPSDHRTTAAPRATTGTSTPGTVVRRGSRVAAARRHCSSCCRVAQGQLLRQWRSSHRAAS